MVKVLIVIAHPKKNSLNNFILSEYLNYLDNNEIKVIDLYEDKFNPVFNLSKERDVLTLKYQELISWSEHITFIYPVWWYNMPAILKGFFDKVFTPGFAYKYRHGKIIPEKLLIGKSVNLIRTFGGPQIPALLFGRANLSGIKWGSFWYTGIKFKGTLDLYNVDRRSVFNEKKLSRFLLKIKKFAKRLN